MIMNTNIHVVSTILYLYICQSFGLLTCDLEGACNIVKASSEARCDPEFEYMYLACCKSDQMGWRGLKTKGTCQSKCDTIWNPPCSNTETTNCKLTEDPVYSTIDIKDIFSAGTKVADPRCQRIHATFSSNERTYIVIKWNAPRSSHIRGFSIQIGDSQPGLKFTEYYMDLRDLASNKCLIGELQSVDFELHCNYTGFSSRLDVILTSLPRLYNDPGPLDNLMSIIVPRKHGTNLPETIHLNKSCQSSENDGLYRFELEEECQTVVPQQAPDHLPYTLGVTCSAFVIAIFIISFLVFRNKTICRKNINLMEPSQGNNYCIEQIQDECNDTQSLNGNGMFGFRSSVQENGLSSTHKSSRRSPSVSQASISTRDIEHTMLKINFGSSLNTLNK